LSALREVASPTIRRALSDPLENLGRILKNSSLPRLLKKAQMQGGSRWTE
jgi:hypothetical protein